MGQIVKVKHYKPPEFKRNNNDNLEEWVGYWRANIHRFTKEYLGGECHDFQEPLLYGMDMTSYFTYAASRGLAKTAIGAWFAIDRAILYPGEQIVITAFEKSQAVEFIKRIETYASLYPNVAKEIESINTGINFPCVKFKNHSMISGKTNSEGSRSFRAHIIIVDEFALFKNENIIKRVFNKALTNTRKPRYADLEDSEKHRYTEPNKTLYLSSIRTETDWSWDYFVKSVNFMLSGITTKYIDHDNLLYLPIALPYHYGVKNGYITEESVAKDFRENDEQELAYTKAEYLAIPVRATKGAFFEFKSFNDARTSSDVLIAMSDEEYILYNKDKKKKWKYYKEKRISKENPSLNEIRIMSIDIALIGGDNNDNTCIDVFRSIPTSKKFKNCLAYSETLHGQHHKIQALRIKQLFYEMECDYCIIDAAGNGVSVAESLMDYTEDSCRGVTYEPWQIANPDDVKMNTLSVPNALPVMYGIKASTNENHLIYLNARNMLATGEIELPMTEIEARNAFNIRYQYSTIEDDELKGRLLSTFVQTSMLIIEATNLVTSYVGANIKLEPKSNRRKDRFTSWVYGLWLIKRFEEQYKSHFLSNEDEFLTNYTIFV